VGDGPGYSPLIIMGLYVMLLLGLGLYGYLKSRLTEEDYYLAGRRQGLIVTTLTIMATFFSSAALLGIPGAIYKDGVAFVFFALNLPVSGSAVYILGSRIARLGRAKGYVTPADMLADYYDGSTAIRLLVALLGFLYVVPYVVIQIRAGGHLADQMFPNVPPVTLLGSTYAAFDLGATVLSAVMMLYILVGGMRSVALADVVQGLLLLSGMLIAGIAVIAAFGGVGGYFRAVGQLPREALSLPGASGRYTPWFLMTVCAFASLASMIQPAQWMRYYAARSAATLRRAALIFSVLLPSCYLFGVMLVGLGARSLYPPMMREGIVTAHPVVGSHDQAVIAVLRTHGADLFGVAGAVVVGVIMMAILAASMSTADSNLHALSAVLTRDVYDRFVRPKAGQAERAWVGRGVIVAATLVALYLVRVGERSEDFAPLRMIVEMMYVAIAFSCQVLPATIDVLFIRRGTRTGAIAGMVAGLVTVLCFTPAANLLLGAGEPIADAVGFLKRLFDIGFCGFVVNAAVFAAVSLITKSPDPRRSVEFAQIMDAEQGEAGVRE
jgi:SSS family solute:Na+ symporter